MTLGSLATFGYADKRLDAAQEIEGAIRANRMALLIDARLTPFCAWSEYWCRPHLERRYEERYLWRGDWLGNIYHNTPERGIQLANEAQGIPWLVRGLEKGYTLILLCACRDESLCHRIRIYKKVKALLGERLPEYEPGQRVMTPAGAGRVDPGVPLQVHRARNRYAVILDVPNGQRYFSPQEVAPFDVHQHPLVA